MLPNDTLEDLAYHKKSLLNGSVAMLWEGAEEGRLDLINIVAMDSRRLLDEYIDICIKKSREGGE